MIVVIRRFYVHNFRCLENFELPVNGYSSALLIGKNGAGKTTVGAALEILQRIARGTNRVADLIGVRDFTRWKIAEAPVRLEIEVELKGVVYSYSIAFEHPKGFREFRVLDETFAVDGTPIYSREIARVRLAKGEREKEAEFQVDWHMVALPIIQQRSTEDPLFIFRQWMARMLIVRPVPILISGESNSETLEPKPDMTDFGAWFSGLLAYSPASYSVIDRYLKDVMPDLKDIKNPLIGTDARRLEIQFESNRESITIPFESLSDGEKCFVIAAVVLAASAAHGPVFCFWDEPDNYLAISEVGHFVMALRREALRSGGQFIATSHNSEAIRTFSDDNTFVMARKSRIEPAVVRRVGELQISGDLVDALIRDDVESLV